VVIIVVLKPNPRVNPKQISGHESGGLIWVDTSQYIDKNNYYHNFKTLLEVDPGQFLSYELGLSTRVDPKSFIKMEPNNLILSKNILKKSQQFFNP
jgi:uncharacterized membrane protein